MAEPVWTDLKLERLREYWTQGISTREIANTLGLSKSAVIGKAKRMKLPEHPNARRFTLAADGKMKQGRGVQGFWTEEKVRDVERLAREGLTAAEIAERVGARSKVTVHAIAHRRGIKLLGKVNPAPKAAANAAEVVALPGANDALPESRLLSLFDLPRTGACKWPLGDVGRPGFAFCGADCDPTRPYCPTHFRMSRGNGTPSERNAHIALTKAVA